MFKVTPVQLETWKQNIIQLAVIYSMLEQDKKIDTLLEGDNSFLDSTIDDMYNKGLLDLQGSLYVVTDAGKALRTKMVAMYDQLMKFEIFGAVNIGLALTEEQSSDGTSIHDDLLDPRFISCDKSEDLRLAMLSWFGEAAQDQLGGKQVDLHQVVFMQKLRAGHYNEKISNLLGPKIWFDLRLGTIFEEIEKIVNTAVKWRDLGADDIESSKVTNTIYTRGMTEQIKRDGERCQCGAFLGMYKYFANVDNRELTECPYCEALLVVPEPTGEECPNCGTDIQSNHRKCRGCGAKIDHSLAAGTVSDVTTETTTYESYATYDPYFSPWGSSYLSYDYYPPSPIYGGIYYDPYYPAASILAFGLVCAIL